jgi:hypothetical protein
MYATIDINHYYLVELEVINGKLESFCNRIVEINTNGFIINEAYIFKNTNVRFGPSEQWNKVMELEESTHVNIINIEKRGDAAYNTFDHWYKIQFQDSEYWVFGFFIEFFNTMRVL